MYKYKPKRSLDLRKYSKRWNEGVDLGETQLELAIMASAFIQNECLVKKKGLGRRISDMQWNSSKSLQVLVTKPTI